MKRFCAFILIFMIIAFSAGACSTDSSSTTDRARYRGGFFDTFDTYVQLVIYAETQQEFDEHFVVFREAFERYHILFDIYNGYDGVNNIHTVNSNAGVSPVIVDPAIIELLVFSKEAYYYTDGMLNIALGPVLSIWHSYRMRNLLNPENVAIPSYSKLREAAHLTDIENLIIDEEANTVFLVEVGMSLDVGATAKAFTLDRVANLLRERGVTSAVIDAGGDVIAIGESMSEGGRAWNIGTSDPETEGVFDAVRVRDMSAATSGNHYRTFIVDEVSFNHIIDPTTLMPAVNFASVSVIHESAKVAEMLSTALFILSFEEGYELAQAFNAAAVWLFDNGAIEYNDRYRGMSQRFGD